MSGGKDKVYDLVGIGVGPFNLGLAALLDKVDNINSVFFEKKIAFSWHEDMLLDNSKLQVHYLKDLVTLVDPTNKYSFLSYLAAQNRLYQFINRKTNMVSRVEFNQYFQWVSQSLSNIEYEKNITKVNYEDNSFKILANGAPCFSKNIVVGTGVKPCIPKGFEMLLSSNVFHSLHYISNKKALNFKDKNIVIIGGGQSGAEIFDDIISSNDLPNKITWVSKRANFQPLEDACFSNEFYTPSYVKYFNRLPKQSRKTVLFEQKLTSDGINQKLADSIYNKLYELRFVRKKDNIFNLLIKHAATDIKKVGSQYQVSLNNLDNHEISVEPADIIILATGFICELPEFIRVILPNISDIEDLTFNEDYSINWEHDKTNKIYIQNGIKHFFGIADPNLSLAAWRNAIIVNSLLKKEFYKVDIDNPIINHLPKGERYESYK